MATIKKFNPGLSAAVLIVFLCHFLIFTFFHFSYQDRWTHQNPYLISLGAILHPTELELSDHKDNSRFNPTPLAVSLPQQKISSPMAEKTKLVKPPFAAKANNMKITQKTSFPQDKITPEAKSGVFIDDDINEELFKPLRLP